MIQHQIESGNKSLPIKLCERFIQCTTNTIKNSYSINCCDLIIPPKNTKTIVSSHCSRTVRVTNWQAVKAQLLLIRSENPRNVGSLKSRGMWGMWCARLGEEHRPPIGVCAAGPQRAPNCCPPFVSLRPQAEEVKVRWTAAAAATDIGKVQNCNLVGLQ